MSKPPSALVNLPFKEAAWVTIPLSTFFRKEILTFYADRLFRMPSYLVWRQNMFDQLRAPGDLTKP